MKRIFRKKNNTSPNVLEQKPYAMFDAKFDKLGEDIHNEKVHITLDSGSNGSEFSGFFPDIYARNYEMEFEFSSLLISPRSHRIKHCINHTLTFEYDSDEFNDMMLDVVDDITKRNGFIYLEYAKECEISCVLSGKNKVCVEYFVSFEDDGDGSYSDQMTILKKICYQLISHDILLFARSF